MRDRIYNSIQWRRARAQARERDQNRCTVARLLGGACSAAPLHVHHIVPVEEGGAPFHLDNLGTTCARHHPTWEALRRSLVRRLHPETVPVRCPHTHRSSEARAICERRLARRVAADVAA